MTSAPQTDEFQSERDMIITTTISGDSTSKTELVGFTLFVFNDCSNSNNDLFEVLTNGQFV